AKTNDTHVLITELPIRKWTEDYRSKVLEKLKENGMIRNITRNNCTNERVHFEIELNPEKTKDLDEKGLEKVFQLICPFSTSNMTCFDPNNKLAKYESPEDIMNEFYPVRLNLYGERRVSCDFVEIFFTINIYVRVCVYVWLYNNNNNNNNI